MKKDILLILALLIFTGIYAKKFVDFSIPPFEDAAMLMRYSQHFSKGHGIVWNIGDKPVDGATDFLFMAVLALFYKIGFSLEFGVRFLTLGSHFLNIALIYYGMRKIQKSSYFLAFFSAIYFAVGPGLFLAAAYFGTPFFVLSATLSFLLAQKIIFEKRTDTRALLAFSLSCLTLGLIRPEGVLIACFIALGMGFSLEKSQITRLISIFGAVFLVLGGTYFLWRWNYFGHPLPNPFYKKGGGRFFYTALKSSIIYSYTLGSPFLFAFFLALRKNETLKMAISFAIPIIGTTIMWVLVSSEMNFGNRFQYPLLPLYLLSFYPLIKDLGQDLGISQYFKPNRMQKIAIILSVLVIFLGFIERYSRRNMNISYAKDGRYSVAVELQKYCDKNYTMAVTEAGLLPLYSKWRAIDTWGLNDKFIAHNGIITSEYLEKNKPDIIVWHGFFSPNYPVEIPSNSRSYQWYQMVEILREYAEKNDYTTASIYGDKPGDTHYYLVNPENPDHDELVQIIKNTPYHWFNSGKLAKDFALF